MMETLLIDNEILDSEIYVEEGSEAKLCLASFTSFHPFTLNIHVAKDAHLVGAYADFSRGSGEVSINVYLEAEGASAEWHDAVLGAEEDKKTISVSVYHLAPKTSGLAESYGIVEGKSRLVFTGASDIRKGSSGAATRQVAKIIVFDPDCQGKCSPILKIDENDIQASHAAIVGKLNEQHLFYLLSRGISLKDARRLITLGYLKPIENYYSGDVKEQIDHAIEGGI